MDVRTISAYVRKNVKPKIGQENKLYTDANNKNA